MSRYRWIAFALVLFIAALRLAYLTAFCPLDLSPDEAHYWDWSQHLDWCYYSKGPLVAWLIRISCELFGNTMLAVRLPAVVCGTLLLLGLYALTTEVYRNEKFALAVTAVAMTLPVVAAGSSLMTIDAPFLCAWMWALVFCHRALFTEARWAWLAAGVCLMLGVLTKHTMVLFVPCVALFLWTTQRAWLRAPGFWVMTIIGALGGLPILIWNALHDWVTFRHSQTHAGLDADHHFRWLGPLNYLGTQCAVLLGFWFAAWVMALWVHRPAREKNPEPRFLWWMSAPVFVFFALFAPLNGGGEPNWPLAGYLSGGVLAAGWLMRQMQGAVAWQRHAIQAGAIAFAMIGLMITVAIHDMVPLQPVLLQIAGPASEQRPMPLRRVDPTTRLRGWRQLAAEVDRLRTRCDDPRLATERWTHASELRFYCADRPEVYCLGVKFGDRDSQYDLWRPNPIRDDAIFRGKTFILVGVELDTVRPAFESFDSVDTFEYRENGQLIAAWKIAVARNFLGWDRMP